jgi:hypothetical protein
MNPNPPRLEAVRAQVTDWLLLSRSIPAGALIDSATPAMVALRAIRDDAGIIVTTLHEGLTEAEAERAALRARAEAAEAAAARLNAANVRLMRRLAPALSAWKAAADQLAAMGQRAVAAEAALATARAEGAAAERADTVEWLRGGGAEALCCAGCIERGEHVAFLRARDAYIAAATAHVRPVEGA